MQNDSLVALLDEDREQVLANIARDRTLPAVQAVLEKEIDRVMYRHAEACGDVALRDSARNLLQAMKNTLPLMDAVGEVRTWQKQYEAPENKGLRFGPVALGALLGGLTLVLASVLAGLLNSRMGGVLAFLKVLLPVAVGCGLLFWSGLQAAKPKSTQPAEKGPEATRTEYLADADKAWHCLRGALLQADGQLKRIAEENALLKQRQAESAPEGELSSAALDLFANLLESACASSDDSAKEAASAMRFYLHNAGIDVTDYAPGKEAWFEFLPAARPGTMRPALVSGGKLVRKGLASK